MHTFCILKASYPLDMFPENLLIIKGGQNIFVIKHRFIVFKMTVQITRSTLKNRK